MSQEKKLTIQEVAEALNLSQTTVSRALSGKGRVSEATKGKIQDFIRSTGRQMRVEAGAASGGQSQNIAVVIPDYFVQMDLPFLRKCIDGACRMADQRGYDVMLCLADEYHPERLERQLAGRKVDGALLLRALKHDPCITLLRQYNVPFVVVGRQEDEGILQADNDQEKAAQEMTTLMLQLGMKRVAYMGGSLNYMVNVDRLEGFRRAMAEAGLSVEPNMMLSDMETPEQMLDGLEAILEQKPECLLCGDDSTAYFALKELKNRGIRVPEDLRLASLYDSQILRDTQPTISAVHYDAVALATAACRMLLDVLSGKDVTSKIVQGHQVVLRESTK